MTLAEIEHFDPWAASLGSVSLDELDSVASLQTRVDRKYVIRRSDLEALAPQISSLARVLDIDGRRQFGYWSTYYDTPDLASYLDTARKRPRRWKVRTRTYLDSDLHFIEVKTRNRRGSTVKTRQNGGVTDHCQLSAPSRLFVATTLTQRLGNTADAGRELVAQLRPTLTTEYERVTLLVKSDSSRATIDTALAVGLPDGQQRQLSDHVIVETKTPGRPSPVDRVLWDRGVRPVSISKFGAGLALLQPSLPASKWNRVLRNDFGWTPEPQKPTI